ncbi:hypothetical protein D1872_303180 [compost metagenome]
MIFCRLAILSFQPFDEAAVWNRRRQLRYLASLQGCVAFEHFSVHQGQTPTIHYNVMKAPYEAVIVFRRTQNCYTQKNVSTQIEASCLILQLELG